MNHPVNLRKAISISEKNKENSEYEKEIENLGSNDDIDVFEDLYSPRSPLGKKQVIQKKIKKIRKKKKKSKIWV